MFQYFQRAVLYVLQSFVGKGYKKSDELIHRFLKFRTLSLEDLNPAFLSSKWITPVGAFLVLLFYGTIPFVLSYLLLVECDTKVSATFLALFT